MFNAPLVDVAVGVVLLYLIVSLLCTAIQEWIAQVNAIRAAGPKPASSTSTQT